MRCLPTSGAGFLIFLRTDGVDDTKAVQVSHDEFCFASQWTTDSSFREFVEELFGMDDEVTKVLACTLCEGSVASQGLSPIPSGSSRVEHLFALARPNSEFTAVACISIEEFLRETVHDGSIRQFYLALLRFV